MRGRFVSLVRALGALVLTLALVVGVPYMLISLVGNPFPSELPSIEEVRILLTQNGQGFTNFIIGTLSVLIWFIWAQLVLALAVEVAATIRKAETRRLPTAPGIQALAARLIAAMTLATTLAAGPLLAPAVGALNFESLAPVASTTMVVDVGPTISTSSHPLADLSPFAPPVETPAPDTPAPARVDAVSLIVNDHTELWDLADAAYGDGVSWKLIAQANAGRFDAQGTMITGETESVAPSTALVLPGVVEAGPLTSFGVVTSPEGGALDGSPAERPDGTHVVESGDSMWSLAEGEVERQLDREATDGEVAEYWVDVVAANQDVSSGDVDLIYPGEELVIPGGGEVDELAPELPAEAQALEGVVDGPVPIDTGSAPASATVAEVDESRDDETKVDEAASPIDANAAIGDVPMGDALVAPPAAADGGNPSVTEQEPARSVSPLAVGLSAFGAAIFSAGIVGAVRRRRDLQRRTRPVGAIAKAPSSEAAAFEAALTHASHEVRQSQQGAGWRMLPAEAVASMRASGPLQLHAEESGELSAVAVLDAGIGTEERWDTRRVELATSEGPVAPSQVEAEVEVVLEAANITQDIEVAEPGAAILPTSLVVGTASTMGDAVLVDLDSASVLELRGDEDAVRRFARSAVLDLAVSDRADDLCVIAVKVGHELTDLERVRPVASFPEALAQAIKCGHALPDSTTPVVVVSAIAPDPETTDLAELLNLGAQVVTPGVASASVLDLKGDHATIWPAGTSVELVALNDDNYRAVSELVETTSSTAIEVVDETIALEEIIDVVATAACPVEAGPVEIKVLGPVEIVGAEAFSSLKAVDVVTYLAFHRHGMDADQIKTWVWPAFDPPTDKAFANVLSRARTGLGTDNEGAPFLSRAGADKTYRLAEDVTTDFDRFRAIVELADHAATAPQELELLKQALELIRGVPFTGGAASSFAWADNHVRAQVEFTIDETVHRCADLALTNGDLATARWAALKGLELVPGCEQCFRRRFLVAGAGNNRTELRRAMADLEASAAADLGEPEAIDTISGELLDLYHELDQALVAGTA